MEEAKKDKLMRFFMVDGNCLTIPLDESMVKKIQETSKWQDIQIVTGTTIVSLAHCYAVQEVLEPVAIEKKDGE